MTKDKPNDATAQTDAVETVAQQIEATQEAASEVAAETVEPVEEVIEEHTPADNPIERGLDKLLAMQESLNQRLVNIEEQMKSQATQSQPATEEVQNVTAQENKPTTRTRNRVKLFRKSK